MIEFRERLESFVIPIVLDFAYSELDRAIQVHGALGWSMDLPLASSYVMARQMRIADGADEVHKSFVANKKAKAYKPVDGWPSEHIPTRKAALRARFAEYLDNEAANF